MIFPINEWFNLNQLLGSLAPKGSSLLGKIISNYGIELSATFFKFGKHLFIRWSDKHSLENVDSSNDSLPNVVLPTMVCLMSVRLVTLG